MALVADINEDLETVGAGGIMAMINISGFKLFLLLRVVDVHTSTFRRAGISVLNSGQGVSRFDLPSALVGGSCADIWAFTISVYSHTRLQKADKTCMKPT